MYSLSHLSWKLRCGRVQPYTTRLSDSLRWFPRRNSGKGKSRPSTQNSRKLLAKRLNECLLKSSMEIETSGLANSNLIRTLEPPPFEEHADRTRPRLDSNPLIEQDPATFRLTGFILRAVRPRARRAWRGAQEWSKRRERQGRSETPRPHRWLDRRSARRRECFASGE